MPLAAREGELPDEPEDTLCANHAGWDERHAAMLLNFVFNFQSSPEPNPGATLQLNVLLRLIVLIVKGFYLFFLISTISRE